MRASASSRAGRRRDERLEREVARSARRARWRTSSAVDVAVAGGERGAPRRRSSVRPSPLLPIGGGRVGAGLAALGLASSVRGRSLASSTFGWSNGSMPRTAPAMAVATSQRTNSPPRSIGSASVDPDDRVARLPRAHRRGRRGRRRSRRRPQGEPDEDAVRAVGRRRRRAAPGRPARSRSPCLPVLSAMSCSDPGAEARDLVVGEERQLVAAGLARARRGRARARRPGCRPGPARGRRRASRWPTRGARRGRGRSATPARGRRTSAPSSARRCRAG